MYIGKSVKRVDGYDKATGRAKYADDLCPPDALIAKILHSTIAHGYVKSFDLSEAEKVPGVQKIFTCFDVPEWGFPTAGHPWDNSGHTDDFDRHLLNQHVRFYGDDIAAVIADDTVSADRALRLIKVEYEELPFVLDAKEARSEDAPQLHDDKPLNISGESEFLQGDYEEAIKEEGLLVFEEEFHTPMVQACHIENHNCFAYKEAGKIVVVSSTQLPHITRRVVGQALGIGWGEVRIIKPYIGGGFGNKQDVLYEPLCAWLSVQMGGRTVKLENSREETFNNTRRRHNYDIYLKTYVRKDGRIKARYIDMWGAQGGYTSHGHTVTVNGQDAIRHMYPCDGILSRSHTIYTNHPTGGAQRGYGFPQAIFAGDAHMENIAHAMGIDSVEFRKKNMMNVGYLYDYTTAEVYYDGLTQCIDKGMELFDYRNKMKKYAKEKGRIRHGVGLAIHWYTCAVWPWYVETDTCRMAVNQDGSIQLQMAETEIGQGADTAFTQIAADTIGVPIDKVHIVSQQDTEVTPYGSGAYASRQTFISSFSITKVGQQLKEKILERANHYERMPVEAMDIVDGNIVRKADGKVLTTLQELATKSLYELNDSHYFSAEDTVTVKSNGFDYGVSLAEVEVDIDMCKVKLLNMLNVHDAGKIVNPSLAEAQVHGGMSMSIGYGLFEELLFDPKTGKMLNGNLLDYKLPSFMDHPNLTGVFMEGCQPTSPLGTRTLGEPPAIGGAPAIRNAIYNATGVPINRIPITPKVLFEEFKKAGLI